MAFTPKTWENAPSTNTPITATELNRMETGISEGARLATEALTGNVELATDAEMAAGTDLTRVPSVKRVKDYVAAAVAGLGGGTTPYTFVASAVGVIPLTIKGVAGQTAQLFRVLNSDDVTLMSIDEVGQLALGGLGGVGMFKAKARGISVPGLRIQAASGQTGNLIIVEDASAVNKMTVSPNGTVNGMNVGTIPGTSISFSPTLILDAAEAVPAGTPAGTVILRRPA